jgi:hypothetical protein
MSNESNKTLRQLQAELPWGANDYTEAYRANTTPHRDITHAALHSMKALGRLVECPEEMDHPGERIPAAKRAEDEKRLADLVILALRWANVHPSGPIDLGAAVEKRLAEKFSGGTRVSAGLPRADPHDGLPAGYEPVPCPDGIPGREVLHERPVSRRE